MKEHLTCMILLDPSPITTQAKALVRDLTSLQQDWDDPLPTERRAQWETWTTLCLPSSSWRREGVLGYIHNTCMYETELHAYKNPPHLTNGTLSGLTKTMLTMLPGLCRQFTCYSPSGSPGQPFLSSQMLQKENELTDPDLDVEI